ncbi:MAG: MbnP family protein [Flavobacteriales bacterium]
MRIKPLKNIGRAIIVLFLAAVGFAGCKQEEQQPPAVVEPVRTVDLQMAVVFLHGAHEYELASTYTNAFGTLFKLDTLRFLLSDTYVVDDDGETLGTYPDHVIAVDAAAGTDTFAVGSLTASHVHWMYWTVGLATALNQQDPGSASPPLNDASLRCGPASSDGYRFVEVEGRWDSDASGDIGPADAVFAYRVCGTGYARPASSRIHGDLPESGAMVVPVRVDIEQLIEGLDMANHPTADATLSELLITNLVTALETEH